jgi:uncharacterized protein (DUF697 family)
MIYESRQNQGLFYLSSFLIANHDTMYLLDIQFKFVYRITKIISKFGAQHTLSLVNKQLVAELSAVLIYWYQARAQ